MYCTKCGMEINWNAKFCTSCGSAVDSIPENLKTNETGCIQSYSNNSAMSTTATSVVAYMTWIGFIIAICVGDKEGAKFYINQALIFNIFSLFCIIPVIGWLWAVYMLVCFILGVIWAGEQSEKKLPLIGEINIL